MTSGNAPAGSLPGVATITGASSGATSPRGLGGLTRNWCTPRRVLQWPYACTSPALASVRAATRTRAAAAVESLPAASGIGCFCKTFGALEFRDIRLGTPCAEGSACRGELPRPMGRLIRDVADAAGVFVDHLIGPIEIQKHRARGGMTAGSEAHLDVLLT